MKLFDLDKILETLTGYIETKIELLKLDAQEELSTLIAKLVTLSLIAACAFLAIGLLSFGLANLINYHLGSPYLGFVAIGGLYLILALLIYSQREVIRSRFKGGTKEELNKEDAE